MLAYALGHHWAELPVTETKYAHVHCLCQVVRIALVVCGEEEVIMWLCSSELYYTSALKWEGTLQCLILCIVYISSWGWLDVNICNIVLNFRQYLVSQHCRAHNLLSNSDQNCSAANDWFYNSFSAPLQLLFSFSACDQNDEWESDVQQQDFCSTLRFLHCGSFSSLIVSPLA